MTGATADRFGIKERGYIKPGYTADLTVIDMDRLKIDEKKPDFKPEGIVHVFVNGMQVLKDGVFFRRKGRKGTPEALKTEQSDQTPGSSPMKNREDPGVLYSETLTSEGYRGNLIYDIRSCSL